MSKACAHSPFLCTLSSVLQTFVTMHRPHGRDMQAHRTISLVLGNR
jgi:hypothetical protein